MEKNIKEKKIYLLIILYTIIFLLPYFLNFNKIFYFNNDLQKFFLPMIEYYKHQIIQNRHIPLYNKMYFSGMPLLGDPQSPLFYLPNILFLFLNTKIAYLILYFIHSLTGTIGMFVFAKKVLKISNKAALLSSLFYLPLMRMPTYILAGHVGIINCLAYLPFVYILLTNIATKLNLLDSIILSLIFSALYINHIPTFLIILLSVPFFYLTYFLQSKIKIHIKPLFSNLFCSAIIFIGLSSINIYYQIKWLPNSTRNLLLTTKETFPLWLGRKEFIVNLFNPLFFGLDYLKNIDTEKWIFLGGITIFICIYVFIKLKLKQKILILISALPILIIASNNVSPFFNLINKSEFFSLLRVTTRLWFIFAFEIIVLLGVFIEKQLQNLKSNRKKIFVLILLGFSLIELQSVFWIKTFLSEKYQRNYPKDILELIKNDKDTFRVFCLNMCIPQTVAVENNLELVEGYNTVQQYNYYRQFWQFTNNFWNYYTLSLPPMGLIKFEKINVDPISLGEFNTKYIISPYEIKNPNLSFQMYSEHYYLYKNSLFLPRAYLLDENNKFIITPKTVNISSDKKIIYTHNSYQRWLIVSEVYSKGWKAFLNGEEEILVQERPNSLSLVNIKPNTKYVIFEYKPEKLKMFITISLMFYIFAIEYFLYRTFKRKKIY